MVHLTYDTLGTSPNDNFMGMRLVTDPDKIYAVPLPRDPDATDLGLGDSIFQGIFEGERSRLKE